MKADQKLKDIVREKYAKIAKQDKFSNPASCCGAGAASKEVYNIMTDDYSEVKGYNMVADLGLGCGLPTNFAQIQPGDTVIDLGSGAGNDCFVARHETGPEGKVIGIDFTEEMIAKARRNAEKLGVNNVEFRYGDIENMPVSDNSADVIVSNCVLNLVPDKPAVIKEMFRVLKPGGHFSISDIILLSDLPEPLRKDAEMDAGCVSGAIQKEEYLSHIRRTGFEAITLQKEKSIHIPDDILMKYLEKGGIENFRNGETRILSITVFGRKPNTSTSTQPKVNPLFASSEMCKPGSGCC